MEDTFEKYRTLAQYQEGETQRETDLRIALITVLDFLRKDERNHAEQIELLHTLYGRRLVEARQQLAGAEIAS